jgi:Holliday junction DNA helicase RuvB
MSKLPFVDLNQASEDFSRTGAEARPFTENLLRPKNFSEYVGQRVAASKLEVFVNAARARAQALDHVLLSGPPGLGKTTLAHIVAVEMGGRLVQAPGPTLQKAADLLAILTDLKDGDVLFVDEIHRLLPVIEETLYPAMEDYRIQLIVGEGSGAQAVDLPLKKFTLVGATTQPGKLTGPLRDRFGIPLQLEFYDVSEMEIILRRSASILGVDLSDHAIRCIAARSRGTPRIANRLLARVRDFCQVVASPQTEPLSKRAQALMPSSDENPSDVSIVERALEFLEVDRLGLQSLDRRYLKTLIEQFKGGPAGVEAVAASLNEDRSTLEETLEPYLLKEGFLIRTARGRMATERAYQHLGLPISPSTENPLLL